MAVSETTMHPILTAETHNFPSGVAPFPGAETGTGGRLRDVQATGRGAHSLAGVSAYCVGNLHIPTYTLPWEQDPTTTEYPSNLAKPLTIEIDASNGASDYGNKYGEPLVAGFTRSFGQVLPSGERVEYIKPIMFTAGVGYVNDAHISKGNPEPGMIVCKIGGPAYRIGVGGGAASSRIQGTADVALDFDAVQRGDAEMENRMNRVIRACIDMLEANPIISIHDQGAGGNGNVLKEIVDPLGARYELRSIPVGDASMSVSEIWTAEYQENNAFLVRAADLEIVLDIGRRENCPVTAIGEVTNDGRVIVIDSQSSASTPPYDLPLSLVLGNMPKKSFSYKTPTRVLKELSLPSNLTVAQAYERVGRLLDVGSKRFLTNKVDRSVTGLIAQQQCVGPMSMPISNVAVLALSQYARQGIAVAIGEQPIKGLVDSKAQARMTVGEVLTNLVFASITRLEDIKMSGNWMWAPKLGDEGAHMWHACEALRDTLVSLCASIDGGKDSLSMAAKVSGNYVKSPGTLTLTAYASCPDITLTITPDLKLPDVGVLVYVDLSDGHCRCGGTALSTVYGQLGHQSPDMNNAELLKQGFYVTQQLIRDRLLVSGHDRSDGGLFITLVEMALAGNCGIEVSMDSIVNPWGIIGQLFNEELGWVFEVHPDHLDRVLDAYRMKNIPAKAIGKVVSTKAISMKIDQVEVFQMSIVEARRIWEDTSIHLEQLQCHPDCVAEEADSLFGPSPRRGINYVLPSNIAVSRPITSPRPRVAVIRQEGSNGDREMLAAFHSAGAEAWDVNMVDLVSGKISLDHFRGIAFCGGFSYADVNDSAKGWAGVIRYNSSLLAQFQWFRNQVDRFSLGVCNGCQLLALLGWIPFPDMSLTAEELSSPAQALREEIVSISPWKEELQPRFLHNKSGRYESRWVTVKIQASPSIMLRGLEGSQLGIWVAHGEGRAFFPHADHLQLVEKHHLAPIRYVDDDGQCTQSYPMNPNNSPAGIAAMCSIDGRHLALMPHPERCVQYWQWPYKPKEVDLSTMKPVDIGDGASILPSPWLKMFQNAVDFCHASE
jgi:phosphoribosylformylglycinamidine synthase